MSAPAALPEDRLVRLLRVAGTVTPQAMGVIGFFAGTWCLVQHADLAGGATALGGGAVVLRFLVR